MAEEFNVAMVDGTANRQILFPYIQKQDVILRIQDNGIGSLVIEKANIRLFQTKYPPQEHSETFTRPMVPAIKENSYPSRFQDYPRLFPKITSVSCRGLFLKPLEKDFYQTYQITVAKPAASRDLQPFPAPAGGCPLMRTGSYGQCGDPGSTPALPIGSNPVTQVLCKRDFAPFCRIFSVLLPGSY